MTHNEYREITPPQAVWTNESHSQRLNALRRKHSFRLESPIRDEADLQHHVNQLHKERKLQSSGPASIQKELSTKAPVEDDQKLVYVPPQEPPEALIREKTKEINAMAVIKEREHHFVKQEINNAMAVIKEREHHFVKTVDEINKKFEVSSFLGEEFKLPFLKKVSSLSQEFHKILKEDSKALEIVDTNDYEVSVKNKMRELNKLHTKLSDLNEDLNRFQELHEMRQEAKKLLDGSSEEIANISENIAIYIDYYFDTLKNHYLVTSKELYGESEQVEDNDVVKPTDAHKRSEKLRDQALKEIIDTITRTVADENKDSDELFYEIGRDSYVLSEIDKTQYYKNFEEHEDNYQKNIKEALEHLETLQEVKCRKQDEYEKKYKESINKLPKTLRTIDASHKTFLESYNALSFYAKSKMYIREYEHNNIPKKFSGYKEDLKALGLKNSTLFEQIDKMDKYKNKFSEFKENFEIQEITSKNMEKVQELLAQYPTFKETCTKIFHTMQDEEIQFFKEYGPKIQENVATFYDEHQNTISWLIENSPMGGDFNQKIEAFKSCQSAIENFKDNQRWESIQELFKDFKEMPQQFSDFKNLVRMQETISEASEKLQSLDHYRSEHESTIATMKKYFERCVKTLDESIKISKEHIKSEQIDKSESNSLMKKLSKAQEEFDNAKSIIKYREAYSTSEKILEAYSDNISEKLIKSHKEVLYTYLRGIARSRFKKEDSNLTSQNFGSLSNRVKAGGG